MARMKCGCSYNRKLGKFTRYCVIAQALYDASKTYSPSGASASLAALEEHVYSAWIPKKKR